MAALALGHLRPRGNRQCADVVERLVAMVEDDDPTVCEAAARMLQRLAPGDDRAQAAAAARLRRLHGAETAMMMLREVAENPDGAGLAQGPRPRMMRAREIGDAWIISERLSRRRWR